MPISSLRALRADRFDYWAAQHLLNRAGFGGTPSQIRGLANLGLAGAVAHIVDYEDVEVEAVTADAFDADIMRPASDAERMAARRARETGDEAQLERLRRDRQQRQRADRRQIRDMQRWWLTRMIETPRPLEEKLTLFWHGHFATGYRTIEDSYHMFRQNQMLRAGATGDFRRLALGIVHDPAMLRYLDNNQNRRQRPNENLARELLELFTLGEGNGYTEQDIKQAARALTGYTYVDDEFVFAERQHDPGVKRIFGRSGPFDGDELVGLIFNVRGSNSAEYICLKLYRFFVNDLPNDPDPSTVKFIKALARQFRSKGYDVGALLTTLFMSEHFYDEANRAAQIKSPTQLMVQTVRSLRTPVRSLDALLGAGDLMGQNLFFPPSVKGWDGGRAWINTATLFVRQNLLLYLLTGRRPDSYAWEADGAPYDATHLLDELAITADRRDARAVATYLLRITLGQAPHPQRVDAIAAFLESCDVQLENDVLIGALALITAMPEFQLC